jgi:hypothetical protein
MTPDAKLAAEINAGTIISMQAEMRRLEQQNQILRAGLLRIRKGDDDGLCITAEQSIAAQTLAKANEV